MIFFFIYKSAIVLSRRFNKLGLFLKVGTDASRKVTLFFCTHSECRSHSSPVESHFQLFDVEQFVSFPPSSLQATAYHSQVRPPRSSSQRATQCRHGDGPAQLREQRAGDVVVGGAPP